MGELVQMDNESKRLFIESLIAQSQSETEVGIYNKLTEIFGDDEELHECILSAKIVVETFLHIQMMTGLYYKESETERLQKAVKLFNLLLEV